MPQTRFALAEGVHPAPDRRHALPDVEVEALDKCRIDGPATSRQDLLDSQPGAEDHPVRDADEASAPVRLDHLGVKQCGPRHPPQLRSWPFVLASLRLPPLTKVR